MTMRIAVLGAGALGTFLAHRLRSVGHEVALVARGARLAELEAARGALRARARGAAFADATVSVDVRSALDPDDAPDLLFVAVRRQHLAAVLPELAACRARAISLVVNVAAGHEGLREAIGIERFLWSFPAVAARLDGEVLEHAVVPGALRFLQVTTIGGLADAAPPALPRLAEALASIELPFVVERDMASWLSTHAAFMAPLVAAGAIASRGAWRLDDARSVARAMAAGFAAVERAGGAVIPANMAALRRLPAPLVAALLYPVFRSAAVRSALGGAHARAEAAAMLQDLLELGGPSAPLSQLEARLDALGP